MDNDLPLAAPGEPSRFFPETGHIVSGPFLAFFEHYGLTLCGLPVTDALVEGGLRTQYFQNLALEEHVPGRVRLRPLGQIWLGSRQAPAAAPVTGRANPDVHDLVDRLPRHSERHYGTRPLADIRYLVLHHTGASARLGPREIATAHVDTNGWPGIGYHFVIQADGTIYQTQDLTTTSYHARQFNPVAVGIALAGDLGSTAPTLEQMEQGAALLARLLGELGLPPQMVRGHREMVRTPCPGGSFLSLWKPRLLRRVGEHLGAGEGAAAAWPAHG